MSHWNAFQATVNVFSNEFSLKAQVRLLVTQTVAELKQRIYDDTHQYSRKLPQPSGFALVYKGKQLNDTATLVECGIAASERVQMSVITIKGIDITLITRYGQTFTIANVTKDSHLKALKEQVMESYGIPIKNQIICNGKNEQNEVNILNDEQCIGKLQQTTFDLIIEENIENAMKIKDNLLDEPYEFIPGQKKEYKYIWQWIENDGTWHDYDDNTQIKLNNMKIGEKITMKAGQF
eukprot:240_1